MTTSPSQTGYIGRFAPSPSGPLHFGSLVAALGSYLQAKSQQGLWRVRIEDIDTPRMQPGADRVILNTLAAHGLHPDGAVLYQSARTKLYQAYLQQWLADGLVYRCDCSRQRIKGLGGVYDGHCLTRQADVSAPYAIRLRNRPAVDHFVDRLQGPVTVSKSFASEDFIVHRRDGLYAYQLAVVVDDIAQGVTEVVRGSDLLEPTVRQLTMYQTLGLPAPHFLHLPVAVTAPGQKLSKQNHAPAIVNEHASVNIAQALAFLGQSLPRELVTAPVTEQLGWAVAHWQLSQVPRQPEIQLG